MIESSRVDGNKLAISWLFDVPVERVWQAWIDPELMSVWMGPGEVNCEFVEADVRLGGTYRIGMNTPNGLMTAYGVYREIDPNKKLVYTWQWENGTYTDSIVTLLFSETDGRTRLELLHTDFPSEEPAQHHSEGWKGCLEKLEQNL